MACAMLVSYAITPVYRHRNLIIILPTIVYLAALALERVDLRWFRGRPVGSAVAVLALLFDLLVMKLYYTHHTKDPFRQFTEHVLASASDGRSFVVWAEHEPRLDKLYFDQYFRILRSYVKVTEPAADAAPAGAPDVVWIMARGAEPNPAWLP